MATPVGKTLLAECGFNGCGVMVDGYVLEADLILLNIHDFDVILGMDWLATHRATVDCFRKEVTFRKPEIPKLVFCRERQVLPSCLISAMVARKHLRKGHQAYLAHVVDTQVDGYRLEDIPMVKDFLDVFPEDLGTTSGKGDQFYY
ncbi:hypothetical protein Pint_15836 [Pistacia integerrima]|uniref:Uncharacterized protein n=1 Tax=Pistacia integerrima TaxID=434235 RepID=A0ACC0ZFQ7_9ROSI|nr:hypothetical protein Pint_15836 [Pistacia integerrima]